MKPCPFCKSLEISPPLDAGAYKRDYAVCCRCGARGPYYTKKENERWDWDDRAEAADIIAAFERAILEAIKLREPSID